MKVYNMNSGRHSYNITHSLTHSLIHSLTHSLAEITASLPLTVEPATLGTSESVFIRGVATFQG